MEKDQRQELSGKGHGTRQIGKSQRERGKSKIMNYLETFSKKFSFFLFYFLQLTRRKKLGASGKAQQASYIDERQGT